jgi:hypothetical protein
MRREVTALLLIVMSATAAQAQQAAAPNGNSAPAALTFDGDIALWTVAIKPDKTADFETVMQRVNQALAASSKPEQRGQASGWKVMRMGQPLPDGSVAYVHVISPVVEGADYTVMRILYDAFPEERQALYELYRGAFGKNVALAVGDVAVNMSATASTSPAAQSLAATPTP